jgi:oligopeptide transport system permease protein
MSHGAHNIDKENKIYNRAPPNASWGILIKEGANFLESETALILVPSAMFALTLFSFNFLGDGLRDALDPKAAKD